jgi:hypothetical protein
MDPKQAYIEAAKRHTAEGDFLEASSMYGKAGEDGKAMEMLLHSDMHQEVARNLIASGKKVFEACAIVAEKLESIYNLELAAFYYKLAQNFEKARQLYAKLGDKEAIRRIRAHEEPNKGWCFVPEYDKLGAKQGDF